MFGNYGTRKHTKEDREKIKEERKKDKQYLDYVGKAMQNVKTKGKKLRAKN